MLKCKCGCGKEVSEGKEFLPGHYAKWKAAQLKQSQDIPTTNPIEKEPIITIFSKKWWEFWKRKQYPPLPKKLLSEEEIKKRQFITSKEPTTDEQKFQRFFGNLNKWTHKKPGWFTAWKLKRNNPNVVIKHCVFVDEDGDDKEAYIPFNTKLGLLQSDDDFYDVPIKSTGTIWLDRNKFAPLVNRKNYKDEFEIFEDLAGSLINTGIGYGELKAFADLINEYKTAKTVMYGCIIAVVILGILVFLTIYADNKAIYSISSQMGNLTRAVEVLK